jgi:hypothetical protein
MWSSFVKIQYTELKLSCGNDPVVNNYMYSNGDLWPFPHDNFSCVYWIFTKLDHAISLWKGKNPNYFGVIRSKVKVTVAINRIVDNRVVEETTLLSIFFYSNSDLHLWLNDPKINRILFLPHGNHVVKFRKDPIYRAKVIMWKRPCCQKLYL